MWRIRESFRLCRSSSRRRPPSACCHHLTNGLSIRPTFEDPPMNLYYGWVVVGAGALMGCVAIGAVFSLAVFLAPMSEATGWSRTGISSAMTIVFVTMGFASFGWGALTDRFGPRIVVLAGGLLLGLGLALASRAT